MANKELNKNTENKILLVAAELFAKNGFEGASTREICKMAGVNLSLISYYFGGKKELYEKIVAKIIGSIMRYMKASMGFEEIPADFNFLSKKEKIELLFKALGLIIDYFYSDRITDSEIMIIFREQMTSGVPINPEGYQMFKRLLASILGRDENDKEIVFRTVTIMGQVHSARIFKQFSLKLMDQPGYSKEDVQMLKQIIMNQAKSILKDLGAIDEV